MNPIKSLIFGTLFPLTLLAGGGQLGNGGDVVVCTQNFKISGELLDVYEARVVQGMAINVRYYSLVGDTTEQQLAQINAHTFIHEIDKVDPLWASRYHKYIESFFDEASFVSNNELTDIPDSFALIVPPANCKIHQLVIQVNNGLVGKKRYIVNKDLWNLLDAGNQALTLVHEVIYRAAIETGQTDSRWTRYFNALIFSGSAAKMSVDDYLQLKRKAYSNSFTYKGYELAGSLSSSQNLYEILRGPPWHDFQLKNGLFDMHQDQVIEARLLDPKITLEGFYFPNGLSLTFSSSGSVERIYSTQILNSDASITITAPKGACSHLRESCYAEVDDSLQLSYEPARGQFKIENEKNIFRFVFSNNVSMSLTLSQVQPLTSKSTAKDLIPQKLSGYGYQAKISFAHGLANDVPLYDIEKISVNDNQLISYSLRNDTWSYSPLGEFEYRIPANFVGNIEDVKHVFRALNTSFDSVGGFTIVDHLFMQDPKSHNGPEIKSYKLVTKSGAILDLPSRKDYEFSFDQDGYLLSAKPE